MSESSESSSQSSVVVFSAKRCHHPYTSTVQYCTVLYYTYKIVLHYSRHKVLYCSKPTTVIDNINNSMIVK